MKKDHAITYQNHSLKNWPHRLRLKEIQSVIRKTSLSNAEGIKYADFGCSTGYLTNIVANMIRPSCVVGFDHYYAHLELAKEKYSGYRFDFIDLNEPFDIGKFDLVTCFETLEHVGNYYIAINNLLSATEKGGTLVITVPIEIGFVGLVKFLIKTVFYGYKLDELSRKGPTFYKYLFSLITYRDISDFREKRTGWGTHFGFDYRAIENYLNSLEMSFKAKNVAMTRFLIIKP